MKYSTFQCERSNLTSGTITYSRMHRNRLFAFTRHFHSFPLNFESSLINSKRALIKPDLHANRQKKISSHVMQTHHRSSVSGIKVLRQEINRSVRQILAVWRPFCFFSLLLQLPKESRKYRVPCFLFTNSLSLSNSAVTLQTTLFLFY